MRKSYLTKIGTIPYGRITFLSTPKVGQKVKILYKENQSLNNIWVYVNKINYDLDGSIEYVFVSLI